MINIGTLDGIRCYISPSTNDTIHEFIYPEIIVRKNLTLGTQQIVGRLFPNRRLSYAAG